MNYIDADRLRAEIRRRIEWLNTATGDFAEGRRAEMRSLYDFIDSLQEEQLIKPELKEEKIECSPVIKEFISKFFEVGRAYNFGFGPKDFLQEQSEVDLEKEYKEYVEDDPVFSKLTNRNVGLAIARHFYELGLNARKEENK